MLKMSGIFKSGEVDEDKNRFWIDFLKRHEYPKAAIRSAAPKLSKLPPDLKNALLHWDKTGELRDAEVEDFTVWELMEYKGLNEIGAVLMLDWLRRDPKEAKLALAEPVTKIVIGDMEIQELERSEEMDKDGDRLESAMDFQSNGDGRMQHEIL